MTEDKSTLSSWEKEEIAAFFAGEKGRIHAFEDVLFHMQRLCPSLIYRALPGRAGEKGVIGAALPGQRFRFYVSEYDGAFFIKYRGIKEKLPFLPGNSETYYACNLSSALFYAANPEKKRPLKQREKKTAPAEKSYPAGEEKITPPEEAKNGLPGEKKSGAGQKITEKEAAQFDRMRARIKGEATWQPLWAKAQRAAEKCARADMAPGAPVQVPLLRLLRELASEDPLLKEPDRQIFALRTLADAPLTLRKTGALVGCSGERVRQRENRAFPRLLRRLSYGKKDPAPAFRDRILAFFLMLPDEALPDAACALCLENRRVGTWVMCLLSPDADSDFCRLTESRLAGR